MTSQHVKIDELTTHRLTLKDGRIETRTLALCATPDREEAFAGTVWCKEHGAVRISSPVEKVD